jgi:hypothetical protein
MVQYNNNIMFNNNSNSNSNNSLSAATSSLVQNKQKNSLTNGNNKVKAKVLFDFEAGDIDELKVSANEVKFLSNKAIRNK